MEWFHHYTPASNLRVTLRCPRRRHKPARRGVDCRPSLALRHPCCPIYPRCAYLPKEAKGPENAIQEKIFHCFSRHNPCTQCIIEMQLHFEVSLQNHVSEFIDLTWVSTKVIN